jgi:hypothetical protein
MSKADDKRHLIPALLKELIQTASIKQACRNVGISFVTYYNWLIRSRNGDPALQECKFFGTVAPFHIQVANAAVLNAQMIESNARQRASEGVWVQVFKDGQPQYRMKDPKLIADMKELGAFVEGDEWERDENGKRVPVLQLTLPPASLVEKMLSAHFPKKYGQRAELDVRLGGVLRIDPNAAPVTVEAKAVSFEDAEVTEMRGGYLAVPKPAQTSEEFEARAAAGEFDAEPVPFHQNDGTTVVRMAEPDPLLSVQDQVAKLQPKPDDRPDVRALKLQAIERLQKAPVDARRPQPGHTGQRLPPAAPVRPAAALQPERWREQDHLGPGAVAPGGYKMR